MFRDNRDKHDTIGKIVMWLAAGAILAGAVLMFEQAAAHEQHCVNVKLENMSTPTMLCTTGHNTCDQYKVKIMRTQALGWADGYHMENARPYIGCMYAKLKSLGQADKCATLHDEYKRVEKENNYFKDHITWRPASALIGCLEAQF